MFLLILQQRVSDVLVMCPVAFHVCCWLAMLAPLLTARHVLILQRVSDWLAARHMCPDGRLFHVCCWLAMLACAPLTTLLCLPCFVFFRPTPHMHLYLS